MARIKRKNLPKWLKPLTDAQIRHLREQGIRTKEAMIRQAEHDERVSSEVGLPFMGCRECRHIANILKDAGAI